MVGDVSFAGLASVLVELEWAGGGVVGAWDVLEFGGGCGEEEKCAEDGAVDREVAVDGKGFFESGSGACLRRWANPASFT